MKNRNKKQTSWKSAGHYSSRLLFLVMFLVCASFTYAQNKEITGTVVDASGDPVIGASVQIKGSSIGGITDLDGHFKIANAPSDALLVVSYVGYSTQTVNTSGKNMIAITMTEDNKTLDDVVVIGYGSVKKSNLTSAVAKMDDKGIKDRPLARAEQALQGQLAGVTARTVNGEPGADMQIRVRGAASVNASSDPLYVVDGVPMSSITSLNPSDIQSIEVLKDAASAAIYGSRGSNGVVIVTTKRGKNGKPVITFNAAVGYQTAEKQLDLLTPTEWMEFRTRWNDANYLSKLAAAGKTGSISDASAVRLSNLGYKAGSANAYLVANDDRWFQYMSDATKASHTYTATTDPLALIDWQDALFRSAMTNNYDLSIQGGTDNVSYLISGGYMKQNGIVIGTDYQRVSFRANVETKVNKYITVGLNIAPTYIVSNGAGNANGKDSEIHHTWSMTPVAEVNAGLMTNANGFNKYDWAGSNTSPWYVMKTNLNRKRDVRVLGNAFIRITPIEDLKIELSGATTYYDSDKSLYTYTSATSNWAQGEGAVSTGRHVTARQWTTLLQALVNYDKTFGVHGVSLMAGASSEQSNVGFNTDQYFKNNFPNDAISESFDGSQLTAATNTVTQLTPDKLVSFFGRASYDYASRYMFSASLRADGGSVFGGDNKWGVFPAVSAGWMISNEKFFKKLNPSWLNTLKLRASYGVTGNNNISNTAAYATLTSTIYGGNAGYYANTLGNDNLGWEKTHSTDVALDFGMLNNRVQLSLDWYTKKTTDLLYQVPVAGASGFTTTWDNLGDIKNEGVDIELTTHNMTGQFKWDTSLNVSYNKNKVLSLGTDDTPIHSGWNGTGDGSNATNILEVGQPVNEFYMYEAIGVWKTQAEIDAYAKECGVSKVTFQSSKAIQPGDIRYRDVNHDGDFTLADDRVHMGQPTPKFTYGMTNTFRWKGFDASLLIMAQTGGKIYGALGRAIDRPSMGAQGNMFDKWNNAWWSETEQGDGKTPYILSTTTGGTCDSRWLYSSDYLSIKNLTIGYTFPFKSKIISNARVYISCENLLRFDSYYEGYSPETSNGKDTVPGGSSAIGSDYGGYPTSKIYTIGINVSF